METVDKFKEEKKDLWEYQNDPEAKIFITTNGTVKDSGHAIMGRGCAKEAVDRFPNIQIVLGGLLRKYGNMVMFIDEFNLGIFPVKKNWYDKADLALIEESAKQLQNIVNMNQWTKIVIPRPGCGNGGRMWEEVKPILDKYFDERFIVVSK